MACRFILGRAGSGKSHYCISRIGEFLQNNPHEREIYFIVPEQSTFVNERLLIEKTGLKGFTHCHVTSFSRLIYMAKKQFAGQFLPVLTENGKIMAMADILLSRKDDLEIFDTAYNKNGFIKLLLHTITEFKMYDIGLDDLQIMEEKWQSANKEQPLSKKLADISLVYEAMNQFCLNKYTDPIDGLQFLASSIEDGNFLQDSLIFIDGFIGFTPQEEAVLAAMMKKSAQIEITLTLDAENMAEELGPEDVFYPIWQTYQRFLALAAENRIGNCLIEKPLLLFGQQGRFSGNKELAFLEKELFPLTGRKKYPQKLNNIFLWTALNKRAEIEMVGKEILRLIREDGWDYRDISIISRNSALYENDLQMIFKDLQIPYFLDIKKPLLYHPLIELLRGVLDLLVEKNHYPYLFRYLKNPLSPLTLEETDILENYCLAAGIRHYHWQKDKEWTFWPFSLGDKFDETAKEDNLLYINQLKVKACREIWDLKEKLAFSSGIIQFSQALQEFLSALEIEEKLLAWSKEDLLHGAGEEAAVNRQVYDDILALLAEAEAFLADSALELEQIVSILDAGLANMSLKLIPPGLDQVFVASLDRSRNPQVKIAFVIGVNAGELPGKISGEGIFNNQERDILREEGWQLAPDSNKKQLAENFLVYTALTRCEEKLYISYKLSDEEGIACYPSPIIYRLREIFPLLEEYQADLESPAYLGRDLATLSLLGKKFQEAAKGLPIDDFWWDIYNYFMQNPLYRPILQRILEGYNYQKEEKILTAKTREQLFGDNLYSSISRLEKYISCPFAYFASYGIKLQKRKVYEITPLDKGQLFHEVLADIGKKIGSDLDFWRQIDAIQADELVEESLSRLLPNLLAGIFSSSARYIYLAKRLKNTLVNSLLLWAEHLKKGDFFPIAWELAFGYHGDLPALRIDLQNGHYLEVSGQIDRLDIALGKEKTWLRVIDYKTGKQTISKEEIFQGLKLQLLVYMQVVVNNAALLNMKNPTPAGFYYSWLRDDILAVDSDIDPDPIGLRLEGLSLKDEEAVHLADRNFSGYSKLIPVAIKQDGEFYSNSPGLTSEELADLEDYLQKLLQNTALEILDGKMDVCPHGHDDFQVCHYCDYRVFCGFDGQWARELASSSEDQPQDKAEKDLLEANQNKGKGAD